MIRAALLASVLLIAAAPVDRGGQADGLFRALHDAPDTQAAHAIELKLHELWRGAASPACAMLLERAARELQAGGASAAREDADAVLVLDPNYAEGFAVRAAARLADGDARGAVADAAEALRREPRHIGALQVLSRASEEMGALTPALEAWRSLVGLDPQIQDATSRLNDLTRRAVGENI